MSFRKTFFSVAWKGMTMGIAEVIPGVSGGTLAFITGIYETLLHSIRSVDILFFRQLLSGRFPAAWERVNGNFLISVLAGMAIGLMAGVFGVTHLLENYPPVIWAFFFGLIVASIFYIGAEIQRWRWSLILLFVLGTILAYWITVLSPVEAGGAMWYVFLSGVLAISALILPGISGSFILLLLGMYTFIIPSVKRVLSDLDFSVVPVLLVFGLGCLTGLAVFSRLLTYTFRHFHQQTIAVLTGFMLGSLNKIWPWRNASSWVDTKGNVRSGMPPADVEGIKILSELNVSPEQYAGEPYIFATVTAALAGVLLIFVISRLGRRKDPVST